jgi:hypothetical protein
MRAAERGMSLRRSCLWLRGSARGVEQSRESGYRCGIFNSIRQPLPDSRATAIFGASLAYRCPVFRAQEHA